MGVLVQKLETPGHSIHSVPGFPIHQRDFTVLLDK